MKLRYYICIDLKSFYASVECVDRGLDPHRPCEDSFRLFGIPGLFRFPFSDGPCDRFGVPSFCPDLLLPVPPLGKGEDRSVTKLNINLDITQPSFGSS